MRRTTVAVVSAALLVPLATVARPPARGVAAAAPCTSDVTPTYAGNVPTGEEVSALGYPIGSRAATSGELGAYLAAVDKASDDVRLGSFGTSVGGVR